MILEVPIWAKTIKDEGVLTFVAFTERMCRQNGYDITYTIHIDDVVRMVNKRAHGLLDWLREFPEIEDNIELGHLYDQVVCFRIKELEPFKKRLMFERELTQTRQKFIWMYLLGCLNQNLITGEDPKNACDRNTFGIKEFHIDREALHYIRKADR